MKRLSNSKSISAMLGISLLVLAACAPDALARGGAAQPIPVERANEKSAAPNEATAPMVPDVNSGIQPAAAASSLILESPLPTPGSQDEIEFTGTIEAIASDLWVVSGRTLAVTAATEIKPGLTIGTVVKVQAMSQADGSLRAREIGPAEANDNGNSNSNGNANSNDDHGNGNVNSNEDHGNDNGNGNVNSNDDHGNDNHSNLNSNDANSNDDHGNVNTNANPGNDDHGGNGNNNHEGGSGDHGGNSNDH